MIIIGLLIFAASYGLGFWRGLTAGTARWRAEMLRDLGNDEVYRMDWGPPKDRPPHG